MMDRRTWSFIGQIVAAFVLVVILSVDPPDWIDLAKTLWHEVAG